MQHERKMRGRIAAILSVAVAWSAAVLAQTSPAGRPADGLERDGGLASETVSPEEAINAFTLADGYRINLVASEREFPDLQNPVALAFDGRGRMWVSCMPTYPQYLPGNPPNDRLLILEDLDWDGVADKSTVFADGLYLPNGFELGNGGAYVGQQSRLWFFRDTNRDDVADQIRVMLHGFGSEDSHHAISTFTWGPGGELHFQEGAFHHSQVETPHGIVRLNDGGIFRFNPARQRLSVYAAYSFTNPWGHVFDRWGQSFVADASSGASYFATPLTGHIVHPAKHAPIQPFSGQVSPTSGCEIVSSRHFPEEAQGRFLINHIIGFHGVKQHRLLEDRSGFAAEELEPLLQSSDIHFRPVAIRFGPDGALYVVDWFNPVIGHMQYSLRDVRRDHRHGRIWRITHPDRPLLSPPRISGARMAILLDLLKEPEDRTRYRVRRELWSRRPGDVLPAAREWASGLEASDPDHEHHLLEALWLHQAFGELNEPLLRRLLDARDERARAAAVRVVRHWRESLGDPLGLLSDRIRDESPRVRLETVLALSFFESTAAVVLALEVLQHPMDRDLAYALRETVSVLEPRWRPVLLEDVESLSVDGAGLDHLLDRLGPEELSAVSPCVPVFHAQLRRGDVPPEDRRAALRGLARLNDSTETVELIEAIHRADADSGTIQTPGLADLTRALAETAPAKLGDVRARLVSLALRGRNALSRRAAFAALIAADRAIQPAWDLAAESGEGRKDLIDAVPSVADPALLDDLFPMVLSLVKSDPPVSSPPESSPAVDGRYVRIDLPGEERTLTLAEVQVISDGVNIAPIGKARQSSTAFGGEANRAIDGNTSGLFGEGGQTHSVPGEANPWWELDLGNRQPIESVVVWNRTEGIDLPNRLSGFRLVVLDENRNPLFTRSNNPVPRPSLRVHFGRNLETAIRRSAIQALIHFRGRDSEIAAALVEAAADSSVRARALETAARVPVETWSADQLTFLVNSLLVHGKTVPVQDRTKKRFEHLLEFGRSVAARLGPEAGNAARAALDELAVQVVPIEAVVSQMTFNRKVFTVTAGRPVEIVFHNPDVMPHNLLILEPGTMEATGKLAETMASDPDGFERQFVPNSPSVLFATNLVQPRQTATLRFLAPTAPGDYPFVCTFPGHWRTMNGIMQVK